METFTKIKHLFVHYMDSLLGQDLERAPLFSQIREKMEASKELVFLLPAFPAKSPSPAKTSGKLPDLGEVLALQGLQKLCENISDFYAPGARVIICSDGRVFSDVVKVSDEDITSYQKGIQEILNDYNLNRLSLFSLDDVLPHESGNTQREFLLSKYAMNLEEVRNLVLLESDYRSLFNGLHKFLLEDELEINSGISKNKASKETKQRTYELMRRSDAWSELLLATFPEALRLSIHPYKIDHKKFGIKLIGSSSKWATPWHNVTVKIKDRFELMHLKEAMKLNAIPKLLKEKYAYFEVANF